MANSRALAGCVSLGLLSELHGFLLIHFGRRLALGGIQSKGGLQELGCVFAFASLETGRCHFDRAIRRYGDVDYFFTHFTIFRLAQTVSVLGCWARINSSASCSIRFLILFSLFLAIVSFRSQRVCSSARAWSCLRGDAFDRRAFRVAHALRAASLL